MKHEFLAPASAAQPPIHPDDDTDVAIVKVLETYKKGFTPDEMHRMLMHKISDPAAIKPTMFALNASGWFLTQYISGEPVYSLRPGHSHKTLIEPHRPTVVRKYKQQPDTAVVDTSGRILLSEGIDVAVWKIMQDFEYRTVRNMLEMLSTFGFDPKQTDRRIMSMIVSNRWFVRHPNGQGKNTRYKLRDDVKCPIEDAPNEPIANFDQPSSQDTLPEADGCELVSPQVTTEHTEVVEKPTPQRAKVLYTDSAPVAVWKILQDFDEYTANEVALLLTDYGFRKTQITPLLTIFFQQGYVTRREVPGAQNNRNHFVYRLKDMPMPEFTTRKNRVVLPPAADSELSGDPTPSTPELPSETSQPEHTPEENMASATPLLQPTAPVVSVAPLLQSTLLVRGVEFTLDEFAQLYKELRKANFGRDMLRTGSMLETTYRIKGIEFNTGDLDELAGAMLDLAKAFQQATTL